MSVYDPLTSDATVDATIGAVTYIVTAFTDSGATAVGPDFTNSDGSYRGARRAAGPREGSMTIECTNAAQAAPAQFATFTYGGSTWAILQVSKASSQNGAATRTLTLRWTA